MTLEEKRKALRKKWQEERDRRIAEDEDSFETSLEAWREYLKKFDRLELEVAGEDL